MPDEGVDGTIPASDWWELEDVLCTSQARVKRGAIGYKMIGHDGPCLVLLHGAFGFSYIWQNLVRQLKETQLPLRLVLLDFYGRGHSPWPANIKECTVSILEQQVYDLITYLQIRGKLLLIGYDIGATVAACFGCKHPEMVAGVVQLGPRGILRELDEVEKAIRGSILGRYFFSLRAKEVLEEAHRKEFYTTVPGTQHYDLMDLHVRMVAWQLTNTPGYLTALTSTLTYYPFHDSHAYKLIYGDKPVNFSMMILHGEEDQLYNGEDFRMEMENTSVASEKLNVIRIPNCGHCVTLEQADDVAAILFDLLKVLAPQMQIPDPNQVATDLEPIMYVERDTDEDHTQIFEKITRATKAPHVPEDLEAGIAFAAMIDAKGVLVERLHRIRDNQRRLQIARMRLKEELKKEDMDLLQVEAAITEGVASFKQASDSGAACYCEHCGGWVAELEEAEQMLGSIARRRAEVDVMAFLASPEERAVEEQRRLQVENERFGPWVPTPAPSLGPSRGAESEGSVRSIPLEPVDEQRAAEVILQMEERRIEEEQKKALEERRAAEARRDRRSQVTGPSQETRESRETRESDERGRYRRYERGYERQSQVTGPSQETVETEETGYSGERRYDRRYDRRSQLTGPSQETVETVESAERRRYDRRSQVPSQETAETMETFETLETVETGDSAEDRRLDRRSQLTEESAEYERRFDKGSMPSNPSAPLDANGLPPLPAVHVHYDFTQPVPVVETVDERKRREFRERGSDEGVQGSVEAEDRRHRESFRSAGSRLRRADSATRRRYDDRYDDRRSGSAEGRRSDSRRREEERRYVSPKRRDDRRYESSRYDRRYDKLDDRRYRDDRRYDDRRYDDRRYDDRRYDKRSDERRSDERRYDKRSQETRSDERRYPSRDKYSREEMVSRETRSMETKSRSTRTMETMSLEEAYGRDEGDWEDDMVDRRGAGRDRRGARLY